MKVTLESHSITGTFWSAWNGDEWLGYLIPEKGNRTERAKALARDCETPYLEWETALCRAYNAWLDRHGMTPMEIVIRSSKLDFPNGSLRVEVEVT